MGALFCLELAGPGSKSWLFVAYLAVSICFPLCALITVRDAPARYSCVHAGELSCLMSREAQPTQEQQEVTGVGLFSGIIPIE